MTQVLIVGAGATGLTLAIELLRRDIKVRIIDIATEYFKGSRGKGIQPRTLELFDAMGIAKDVIADGILYPYIKMHWGPLSIKTRSLGTHFKPSESRPFPNLIMLEQWRTEEILREKVHSLGGLIESGIGIETLSQNKKNVTAILTTGEVLVADYVVGCDGGRSQVRKLLALQLVGSDVDGLTSIVADIEMDDLDRNFWHAYPMFHGGMRSLAPLPFSGLFQLQAPENIASHGLKYGIEKMTKKTVKAIHWQSQYKHQARMVEQYSLGRIFIAGDAAHIHPPSGGQGLNTGIQDAFNLGWKLVSAIKTNDPSILSTYEAERLPVAASVLNLTKKLHVTKSKLRGDQTNQLGLSYHGGPLATTATVGEFRSGDRITDRRLKDGQRLFEVLRCGAPIQIMKADRNHILVRPDGYIAEINQTEVSNYKGLDVIHVEG
ncbi:hypothetical protein FM020_03720 [Acinetobacter tandoii]|nr:hypothetical protein FM020_03720 [Acinetobacter tandoii]